MGMVGKRAVVAAAAVLLGAGGPTTSRAQEGPTTGEPVALLVDAAGANGEGRIETPGRRCADGGQGAYWNYDYGAPLDGGVFSSLPGDLRLHLALHSDLVRFPNSGTPVLVDGPSAFLLGDDSHATLANARGTLRVRLRSGSCDGPTLSFDGVSGAGGGTWEVDSGQGSYREATGSGTFTVQADVAPGADNPFALQLDGDVAVLQPNLQVEVLGTFWGSLGTDYVTRRVTVTYRVTNTGPGDAFDARIAEITSSTPGVVPLGAGGIRLGDLEPGDSEVRNVRFQLGLAGPCELVILDCRFTTETDVEWHDALDVVTTPTATNTAQAPTLPPPL
jgi:hypothetical protein